MKNLRTASEITFPLRREGRTLIDAEGNTLFYIARESACISPVLCDQLAQRVLELLNTDKMQPKE